MDYQEFLKSKQKTHIESGFDVPDEWLNKNLLKAERKNNQISLF